MLRNMYGLKKEIDLSFLTGRELIQVAIGSFQVQFRFDEDVAVPVGAEFRYFDGQQEWIWRPNRVRAMSRLERLLCLEPASYISRAMRTAPWSSHSQMAIV